MAAGAKLLSERLRLPRRQPRQPVHLPPARAPGEVPERPVQFAAHFRILAAPPIAAVIQNGLLRLPELNVAAWLRAAARKFNLLAEDTAETDAIPRFHLVSIFAMLLLAALVCAPNPPKRFRAEFDPTYYPAGALA